MRAKVGEVAFERAVREHHAAVYGTALRILRDDAAALDAAQQTFLKVLDGRIDIAGLDDAGRTLRCAAAREALMLLRSNRSRQRREQDHAMQRPEHMEERALDEQELFGALNRALGDLPEDLRQALVLRFQVGLTFAEVGGSLAISEASAHQRVQRGVEKLREQLKRLGFAAAITDPAELLGREALPSAPAGVEKALLSLKAGALAKLLSLPVLVSAIAGVVLVAAVALRIGAGERARAPISFVGEFGGQSIGAAAASPASAGAGPEAETHERLAIEDPARQFGAVALLPSRDEDADARAAHFKRAIVDGRVTDVVGIPVEGAEVYAGSHESGGKIPVYGEKTRTDADGRFHLELAVGVASGQDYELTVGTATFHQRVGALRAKPGQTAPFQRIQLAEEITDRPGHWDLDVRVVAADGHAISGAFVYVEQPVRWNGSAAWLNREAGATADGSGVAHISGEVLGPKLVHVDARAQGFAPRRERLAIDTAKHFERVVSLDTGVTLAGTILDELGQPLSADKLGMQSVKLYATSDDPNDWLEARIPEPGRFEIPALARGPHTLHFRGDPWSSFTRDGVMPGGAPIALRLKLQTDVADVGTHDAELHGTAVDAASGAPIPLDFLDAWVETIAADSPAIVDRDFGLMGMSARTAQVMQIEGALDVAPPPPPHTFVFDGLERGTFMVCLHVSGYAPALAGPFELGDREIRAGIEVRLARGATVEGVVLDASGRPLEGAVVTVLGPGELSRRALSSLDDDVRSTDARGYRSSPGVRTDATGHFSLAHVPIDRPLHLVALHAEFEPLEAAQLVSGGVAKIEGRELRFTRPRAR
jgi:RNA polymerase sigma factor (sigma-70 family)